MASKNSISCIRGKIAGTKSGQPKHSVKESKGAERLLHIRYECEKSRKDIRLASQYLRQREELHKFAKQEVSI